MEFPFFRVVKIKARKSKRGTGWTFPDTPALTHWGWTDAAANLIIFIIEL